MCEAKADSTAMVAIYESPVVVDFGAAIATIQGTNTAKSYSFTETSTTALDTVGAYEADE